MQSREMGQKKSSEFRWLLKHLTIQWLFFAFGLVYFVGPIVAIAFATLNALVHGVIDWYIWRGYKLYVWKKLVKKYEDKYPDRKLAAPNYAKAEAMSYPYWEDHLFYSTIGLDQLLHCLTIIALFGLL